MYSLIGTVVTHSFQLNTYTCDDYLVGQLLVLAGGLRHSLGKKRQTTNRNCFEGLFLADPSVFLLLKKITLYN